MRHAPDMARVLILFAHPALHKSRINRAMADAVRGLDGVTFHDLYEKYPDMHIAVDAEQRLLAEHEVLVLQHPIFWYSSPAILKEWQDMVLEWGFAFGEGGTALRGKRMLSAISTGGTAETYARGGVNHFSIAELLAPFEQTARFCGMEWLPPFVVHGAFALDETAVTAEAARYRRAIESLRDGK
jgi:glutathione-regulated potassium-efflux system ancillary protein KefG